MNTYATSQPSAAIQPEIVAAKLCAIQNLEYPELFEQVSQNPRLVELLWFLQAMSLRPGGLKALAADLLKRFPGEIGTVSMLGFGVPKTGRYNLDQCRAVWGDIPKHRRSRLVPDESWRVDLLTDTLEESHRKEYRAHRDFENELLRYNREYFLAVSLEAAAAELPGYLASLCSEQNKTFSGPWYCPKLVHVLLEYMNLHAEETARALAKTKVANCIFDALEFSWAEKVLVRIEGDSRFGKTEAIQTWCDMRPGRARLVTVPCSSGETALFRAFGEALGIQSAFTLPGRELREKVEFILRYGQLALILDEGHFLIPERFSAHTPPARLNWIRAALVDRNVPCVIAVTPQAYRSSVDRFVKKTRYAFEQWLGRHAMVVDLPKDLNWADLLAVAKIHFPEIEEECLEVVAAKAMRSESYLKAVEHIAKRARYLAAKHQRPVTMTDIDAACVDVLREVPIATPKPRKPSAEPSQSPGRETTPPATGGRSATPATCVRTEEPIYALQD